MKRSRWVFGVYNICLCLVLPLVLLYVMVRWRGRFAKGLERWSERWGRLSEDTQRLLKTRSSWWWVHAVSLGEVKAIEAFLRRARDSRSHGVLLSVITPEALAYAEEKQVADLLIAAPIDLPWVVRRAFQTIHPQLFISVESEFWPNLLRGAQEANARVALINGRLSARSFRSYQRVKFILDALWRCFDLFAVRETQDAERLQALGVPKSQIQVTGNLKYDLSSKMSLSVDPTLDASLTVVIGSTREKEEKLLLPIVEKLRQRFSTLRVIWAPRHIERVSELEAVFAEARVPYRKKTQLLANLSGEQTILWDSMGDLLDAYRQATVAVIGGSFVLKGGQNPIEPAALQIPVVFGPSMDNFHAIAESLVKSGGARQVTLDSLESCLTEILGNAELRRKMGIAAREAVESQQGATERTLQLLEGLTHA